MAAGTDQADADGLSTMSMSKVAASLGVGTMTLYTYVPSKAELIELMVDQALTERDLPGPGDPRPDDWRDQVRLYADRTQEVYRRHPWLAQASSIRPPLGPGTMYAREYLLSCLRDLGLTASQLNAAALAIGLFVETTTRLEADSNELERTTGQSNDAWWGEQQIFWEKYFDMDRHPTMVEVWNAGGFEDSTAAYDFGFDRLLDGIQALIDNNSP